MTNTDVTVLVTGASGYIAVHVVKQLLKEGYNVRGTVRSLQNELKIRPLRELCPEAKDKLELVEADLLNPDSWPKAVDGCKYVIHVASPFVTGEVKDENILIKPAVEGTLNVLRACAGSKGGVERVVLTSSVASIIYGHPIRKEPGRTYTEADWTFPNGPDVGAYVKSKTLAEKAAWDFVETLQESEKLELSVINPGFVLGPLLHNSEGASAETIRKMMTGGMPMLPKLQFAVVDVRDVGLAHVRAMQVKEAAGKRFILSETNAWFKDIAGALAPEFNPKGYSLATREAPTALLKMISWFDSSIKGIIPRCDYAFNMDNTRMREILNIQPISLEVSAVDMAYSMIERGLIRKTEEYTERETQS